MRKYISLTPAQILFIRMAVDHVVEFGEDTGDSPAARAAELKVANGITDALSKPVPVAQLASAAKLAMHWLEMAQETLDEGGATAYDDMCEEAKALTPAIRRLRTALSRMEGR